MLKFCFAVRPVSLIVGLVVLLGLLAAIPDASMAAPPPTIIYKPIPPAPGNQSRAHLVSAWEKGSNNINFDLDPDLISVLVDYQQKPGMDTAIGVLRHYKRFHGLNDDQRSRLFAAFPKVFQSLDAAKYELTLQTSKRMGATLDYMMRVTSSGKRFEEWAQWAKGGSDIDNMPPLDPAIQFQSDDDISHVATKKAQKADILASERINGATANQTFRQVAADFGMPMDAEAIMVEFLSPLQTFNKYTADGKKLLIKPSALPLHLQAMVNSNLEKYNGLFAEEQLDQWARGKGILVDDLSKPLATKEYGAAVAADAEKSMGRFLGVDDLNVWLVNNHRMIFQVHGGDLRSLAKYSARMIAAYEYLGIDVPTPEGIDLIKLRNLARQIYRPASLEATEAAIREHGGKAKIKAVLNKFTHTMVIHGHRGHLKKLLVRFKALSGSRDPNQDSSEALQQFAKRVADDPEIQKLEDNLALAYSNIDDDLKTQLMAQVDKAIEAAFKVDDDGKAKVNKGADAGQVMRGLIARSLREAVKQSNTDAVDIQRSAEAFRNMRSGVGDLVNQTLFQKANITLDDLLVGVAKGELREDRLVFDGWRVTSMSVRKDPVEVEADLMVLKSLGDFLGWPPDKLADEALTYFQQGPSEGVAMLQTLHRIFDPESMKTIQVKYTDENGKTAYRTIQPTMMQRGLSLGIVTFKAALKGYSLWNDGQDAIKLYQNMQKMYGKGLRSRDISQIQAESLALFIGLVEYAEVFKSFGAIRVGFQWPIPTGTLTAIASLSGGQAVLDRQAQQQLALAAIKDLSLVVCPQLAVFFTLYDLGAWGYNEYMLRSADDGITKLLVENGKWDFEKLKGPNAPKPGAKGNKHPEFLGYCVEYDKDGKSCKKFETDPRKLAKLKFQQDYPAGIMLKESKRGVMPRDSLLEIGYRRNYIGKDSVLGIYAEAATKYFRPVFAKLNMWSYYLANPKDWTEKNLESVVGVKFKKPFKEDALPTDIPVDKQGKRTRAQYLEVKEKLGGYALTTVGFPGLTIPWAVSPDQIVSAKSRGLFGLLVGDYWIKRQVILEGPVLDAVLAKASREAYKKKAGDQDWRHLYKEFLELVERAKRLDDNVWDGVADSAIPNYDERKRTANDPPPKPLDPDKVTGKELMELKAGPKYPVTRRFLKDISFKMPYFVRCVEWLNKDPNDREPFMVDLGGDYVQGHYIDYGDKELEPKDVEKGAQDKIKEICDVLFKFEEDYDKIIGVMSSGNGYVAQGLKYDLQPKYHISLEPAGGRAKDTKRAGDWLTGYKEEVARTELDVATFLRDQAAIRGQGFLENLARSWGFTYNVGDEVDAAPHHPHWPRLLRLRFQIRKFTNIEKHLAYMTEGEFKAAIKGRMLLNMEPLTVPDDLKYARGTSPGDKDVAKWIAEQKKAMEEEYDRLIRGAKEVFDLELTYKPAVGSLQVLTIIKAEARIRFREQAVASSRPGTGGKTGSADGGQSKPPPKSTPGSIKPDTDKSESGDKLVDDPKKVAEQVNQYVRKYRWRIYDEKHNDYYRQEIEHKKFKNPIKWHCPLLRAGHMFLEVSLIGDHGVVLGQAVKSIHIKEAQFRGKLKIWGDWPVRKNEATVDFHVQPLEPGSVAAGSSGGSAASKAGSQQLPKVTKGVPWALWRGMEYRPAEYRDYENLIPQLGGDLYPDIGHPWRITRIHPRPGAMKKLVESDDPATLMYGQLEARALYGYKWLGANRAKASDPVIGLTAPGELSLDSDHPLEIFVPYREEVAAQVTDASQGRTKAEISLYVDAQTQPKWQSPGQVDKFKAVVEIPSKSAKKHLIHAKAMRRSPKPKVQAISPKHTFDPTSTTPVLKVWLPFYEKDRLTIKGTFVPEQGTDPPANLVGGIVRSDIGYDTDAGAGGVFSFKNKKPWAQSQKWNVLAVLWTDDSDGRVFKPINGSVRDGFVKPKIATVFDMGDKLYVKPAEVNVDPIKIKVLDLRGRELPADKIKVTIGDKQAALDGKLFKGAWTFHKRREKVKITATLDRSSWGAKAVKGHTEYQVEDKAFFTGKVALPAPLEIRLDVFYPLSINLTNTVETPQNKNPPLKVKIDSVTVEGMSPAPSPSFVDANSAKFIHLDAPIAIGQVLTLKARAKNDGVEYTGTASVVVPTRLGRLDMTVVLKPKKKTRKKLISITNLSIAGQGGRTPKVGQGMSASAQVTVGDIDVPQLSVEWQRMSDGSGAGELDVLTVKGKNTGYPVSHQFPPLPDGVKIKHDQIKLTVNDGGAPPTGDTKIKDFEWESGDRFVNLGLAPSDGKAGEFKKGSPIIATSRWEIASDLGDVRTIIYSASGAELARETVTVAGQETLGHSASLPTGQLPTGQVRITAELSNADPPQSASGSKVIVLKEDKDQIRKAAAVAAGGDEIINPGEQVHIWALVQGAEGKDGNRILMTRFRGQRPSVSFPLQGGQISNQALVISTNGLRPSRYQTRIYLLDTDGNRQDSRLIRFTVQEKRDDDASGLQDVVCSRSRITIKFWDHANQDDDIAYITVGKKWRKTVNLNACGGPEEPAAGPCVLTNLKLPRGQSATITVLAITEGKYKPNTAALKVIGGCSPTEQHWRLGVADSPLPKAASIRIMRGNPRKKKR